MQGNNERTSLVGIDFILLTISCTIYLTVLLDELMMHIAGEDKKYIHIKLVILIKIYLISKYTS